MPRTRAHAAGSVGFQQATGTYTGDGAATQAIVGVGFQPKFVVIYKQGDLEGDDAGLKTDQDAAEAKWCWVASWNWRYVPNYIVSLDADGFTVGDSAPSNVFNILDKVYTYVAFG